MSTEDDDYLTFDDDRGLVLYIGSRDPSPGDVVAGIRVIADAYDDHRGIEEHVPNGWV